MLRLHLSLTAFGNMVSFMFHHRLFAKLVRKHFILIYEPGIGAYLGYVKG